MYACVDASDAVLAFAFASSEASSASRHCFCASRRTRTDSNNTCIASCRVSISIMASPLLILNRPLLGLVDGVDLTALDHAFRVMHDQLPAPDALTEQGQNLIGELLHF